MKLTRSQKMSVASWIHCELDFFIEEISEREKRIVQSGVTPDDARFIKLHLELMLQALEKVEVSR